MLAPDTLGSVDQRAWDGYKTAAASLATQVLATATAKAKVLPCTTDNATCIQQFITTFGQKAFRRPLTPAEVTRFQNLYTNRATLTQNGTFDQAVTAIIKAFLMSPSFLSKTETSTAVADGSMYQVSSWEMASRLSYTLWGTMPDETLFTAAQQNKLLAQADILAQAQRMLQDPRARVKVAEFHEQYALQGEATRWSEAAHDPAMFPQFKSTMVPMLSDEAKKFFDYITFDAKGTFQDLMTKPIAFVNKDLAPIYGVTGTFGTDLTMANLDPAQRAGVFTHVGFLASYSSYNRTSPILRGAFLEKQVLCRQIGAPPDGAVNTPLPTTGNTNREMVTAQTSGGTCVGLPRPGRQPAGLRARGVRQHRRLADLREGHRRGHRQRRRRRHRREDRARHRPGRPDEGDRRFTGRAELLRAAAGDVRLRAFAHQPGRLHRPDAGGEDEHERIQHPRPADRPHPNPVVPLSREGAAVKRRLFLKGVGGASLAAPFLPSLMAPRTARAASNGPQRLVIFYTNNGCLTNRWFPKTAARRRPSTRRR